jgi:formiminoglutamase
VSTSFAWSGRDDGSGPEHRRFYRCVGDPGGSKDVALLGFASDEGVRRNGGRVGAAAGPAAIRSALAPLAVHDDLAVVDHGDVVVSGGDLEEGQARLGAAVAAARDQAPLTVVLGGGHETAYGSYLGLGSPAGLGILNLDAHFDLREADRASSGTPFLQIARDRLTAGQDFRYGVVGISEQSNTPVLFDRARELGVRWVLDDASQDATAPLALAHELLGSVESVYLTVDLDVLPAGVAPGVSAPAALGVPLATVQAVCDAVADSGRLVHLDVTELNPGLDVDGRTARVAARLVQRVITRARAARTASVAT